MLFLYQCMMSCCFEVLIVSCLTMYFRTINLNSLILSLIKKRSPTMCVFNYMPIVNIYLTSGESVAFDQNYFWTKFWNLVRLGRRHIIFSYLSVSMHIARPSQVLFLSSERVGIELKDKKQLFYFFLFCYKKVKTVVTLLLIFDTNLSFK